jgi:uncharacterized OB-fold protein
MQIAKSWRRQPANLRLEGTRCEDCGRLSFPAALRCSDCGSVRALEFRFCGRGEVLAVTVVYEAPRDFAEHVPYPAAIVRLEEGIDLPAMLTDIDPEDAQPGLQVTMCTRRIAAQGDAGPIVYAYKFAPAGEC